MGLPGALRLGEEIEERVRLTEDGRAFVTGVSPGDWLAVHWDLAGERLAADDLWQLRRWTDWQLAATNARLARETSATSASPPPPQLPRPRPQPIAETGEGW